MIGNSNNEYKIPYFTNTDSPRCPAVSSQTITTKDCSTLHNDFVNSGALAPSFSSGFFYGKLVNETKSAAYDFCLKVYASYYFITIKNLEFIVCSPDSIKPSTEIVLKQWVFVGDENMEFLIPEYTNKDPRGPKVIS